MIVYVLHRNVEYEFGQVYGVFLTAQAAVLEAKRLAAREGEFDSGDEYSVLAFTPSDSSTVDDGFEIWSIYRGKIRHNLR